MYTSSLPLIPTSTRIHLDAEQIARDIQLKLTWDERQPIEAYGRCCKKNPRAYTERYVRDRCPECQKLYMDEYNARRRGQMAVQP
jgi:hypothetical protein